MAFDQYKYIDGYNREHYDRISVRVPKGVKAEWQEAAKGKGLSMSEMIARAVDEFLKKK